MSILDTLRGYVSSSSGVEVREFRCNACGATFDSAKTVQRATCPECLDSDVSPTVE